MKPTHRAGLTRWMVAAACAALLAACASGPPRRVSEPSARVQQLTVRADGSWSTDLRIENFSSVPMRFDAIDLAISIGDSAAGSLRAQPAITVGPESADVVTVTLAPSAAAKFAIADALAQGRGISYSLRGTVTATPVDRPQRTFQIERDSALSPAPGLPGVLR